MSCECVTCSNNKHFEMPKEIIEAALKEELAFRSEIHRTYIASLEVGKRNISIETLEKVVNALEVSMSEFFKF